MFEAFKLIISFLIGLKNFLLFQKKREIIQIKDEALESRDQRELESVLSENNNSTNDNIVVDNYAGMYERPVKKKP